MTKTIGTRNGRAIRWVRGLFFFALVCASLAATPSWAQEGLAQPYGVDGIISASPLCILGRLQMIPDVNGGDRTQTWVIGSIGAYESCEPGAGWVEELAMGMALDLLYLNDDGQWVFCSGSDTFAYSEGVNNTMGMGHSLLVPSCPHHRWVKAYMFGFGFGWSGYQLGSLETEMGYYY